MIHENVRESHSQRGLARGIRVDVAVRSMTRPQGAGAATGTAGTQQGATDRHSTALGSRLSFHGHPRQNKPINWHHAALSFRRKPAERVGFLCHAALGDSGWPFSLAAVFRRGCPRVSV